MLNIGTMDGIYTTSQAINNPINIYRTPPSEHITGWIILSSVLAVIIIILLFLWTFGALECNKSDTCDCFGIFGIELNVDAAPINACGSSRTDPCSFSKATLDDCVNECNSLSNICNAFTFNASTATMKIVQPSGTFSSAGTNLFVRQKCDVS